MALIKEVYSANGISRIYQLLKNEADNGTPKEYDIRVDALKVVSRNNDPERFFEHETFLLANCKHITVNIYDGSSPRCTKYMLLLSEEAPGKEELSGIEKAISAKMQQERKIWEHDRQKQELATLRQELADMERYSGKLEEQITQMRQEKQKLPGRVTETLISLAGAYITRNPNALNGIPILRSLLGVGASNEHNDEMNQEFNGEQAFEKDSEQEPGSCSFSKKETLKYTGEATEEDFDRLENALTPLFPDEYRETVATVVSVMYHNHQIIPQIATLLEDEEQPNKQAA
jgi:hypothetical protein